VVVGIGLNLDPRWVEPPPGLAPASVAEVVTPPDMPTMLGALRRYLLEACGLLTAGGWPRLLPALRARDHLRGRALVVQDASGRHTGTGAGLDDEGRLLIDGPAGRRALTSGSVVDIGAAVRGARAVVEG
jgi:BirA family biotin operon repressor/biotin-[acetyl-CoA-carboxylase] ligase